MIIIKLDHFQISPIDHLFVLVILFLDFHDTVMSLFSVSSLNTLEEDRKIDLGSNSDSVTYLATWQ